MIFKTLSWIFFNNTIVYRSQFIRAIYKDINILLLKENSYVTRNVSVSIFY